MSSKQSAEQKSARKRAQEATRLLTLGRYREALSEAREVLRLDPSHVGALEVAAKTEWHLGAYEPLLDTLDRLIGLNPYEPGYHALRGATLQALGRCGEAVRAFERCAATPGPERDRARAQVAELESWEHSLIADLLREDRVFRAEYAHNPREACQRRGFEFASAPTSTAESAVVATSPVVSYARPS